MTQGFKQKEGIGFNLVYSPVIKSSIICIVLSIKISRYYILTSKSLNHVCRLNKPIFYGLKQAPRS